MAIAACTRLIGAGTVRGNQLADLFAARGNAYRAQADFAPLPITTRRSGSILRAHSFSICGATPGSPSVIIPTPSLITTARSSSIRNSPPYVGRASAHFAKGDLDAAIADYQVAIEINPRGAGLYLQRGHVWRRKGDLARAIADYSEALRIAPAFLVAHVARGITLEAAGDRTGARADYEATIAADARGEGGIRAQATARERLAMLANSERSAAPNANATALGRAAAATAPAAAPGLAIPPSAVMHPQPPATSISTAPATPAPRQSAAPPANVVATVAPAPRVQVPAPAAAPGLRLALVIGNGAYVNATPLPNPPNDAAVVAKALRGIGFEVIEGTNLDRAWCANSFTRRRARA